MTKKAIIFDLDETLRKLTFDYEGNNIIDVNLRPNIENLLKKLEEMKQEGIDVMIWTTASTESAQKYFLDYLPEEYRNVFCKIISRDNKVEVPFGSKEEKVYGYNTGNKPVTLLNDYDQILFFDDNSNEQFYLKGMYRDNEDLPNKQVTFVRYPFSAPKEAELYAYGKLALENEKFKKVFDEYINIISKDPGCELMIKRIDEFRNRDFTKELICHSEKDYTNEKNFDYIKEKRKKEMELYHIIGENDNLENLYQKYYDEYYVIEHNKDEKLTIDDLKNTLAIISQGKTEIATVDENKSSIPTVKEDKSDLPTVKEDSGPLTVKEDKSDLPITVVNEEEK